MVAKQPNTELIDYQFKVMKEGLDSHRSETNIRFDRLEKLITDGFSSLPTIYATKEEHNINKQAIEEIRSAHTKIAWSAISFIGATIIGVISVILKKLGII